jgi:cytochrome c553
LNKITRRSFVGTAGAAGSMGALLLVAGIGLEVAAGAATAPAPAEPTPAAPKSGASDIALCQGCHGARGEGMPAAGIPRLAGQAADYLQKQLNDYASGTRENPIMVNWAKQLNDAQRVKVSAYYASLRAPYIAPTLRPSEAQLARGHQLAHQGDESLRVQACNSCHGPDGSGVLHTAPYLAGQSAEYLASALKSWQQGTRHNDAGKLMAWIAGRLQDADIGAVTAYYASLAVSAS